MNEISFSHSRIETYLNCPTAFYWRYVRDLVSNVPNINLKYGEIIHSMFNTFFCSFNETGSEEVAFEEAKEALIEEYVKEGIEHNVKNIETGLKFLEDVIEFGLHKKGNCISELKLVEPLFKLDEDTIVTYNGKIDLTIQLPGDLREIYDFKTISRFSGNYYMKQEMNRQFLSYSWLSGTDWLGLIPLHCVQKAQAKAPYSIEYSGETKEIWFSETIQICSEILNKIKKVNSGAEAHTIFWKACSLCTDVTKAWGCDYEDLCWQGKFEDVYVDLGKFKTREKQT